jgi:hypothetical protein
MFIYLVNGEVAKVPVSLALNQDCNNKFLEMVKEKDDGTKVLYNDQIVGVHYCKTINGEWVR